MYFRSLEKLVKLVLLAQFDDVHQLCGVCDIVKHLQVIQVQVIHHLAEGFVVHLAPEVDYQVVFFFDFVWQLFPENLCKVCRLGSDNPAVAEDVYLRRLLWFFSPKGFSGG